MAIEIPEPHYTNRLRVRVCGICPQADKILLIRHRPFAQNLAGFWSPPGGGLQYGETMVQCLKREFAEETGLEIEVGKFLFLNEFVNIPLHALEAFFTVTIKGGTLVTGHDPELPPDQQLIAEAAFMSLPDIQNIPTAQVHRIFHNLSDLNDLMQQPSLIIK